MNEIGVLLFYFLNALEILHIYFCKNFVFYSHKRTDFKKGIHEKTACTHVCLLTPLVSFCFTLLSTAFEKVLGGIFDRYFLLTFFRFLSN